MSATQNQGFLIQAEALQSLLKSDKTNTLVSRYYLLMVILTLIELSALISKLILETGSYGRKVDYYIDKEKKEIDADKELFTNKIDNYRSLTLERETSVIKEFFEKTNSVRQGKMDDIIRTWQEDSHQTYSNTWGIMQNKLFIHNPEKVEIAPDEDLENKN